MIGVAPSLLSADFGCLRSQALLLEPLVVSFHVDVMDGHFVPNLTMGPPVVNRFREGVSKPLDIHLMIDHPRVYGPQFRVQEGDSITFHVESADPIADTIDAVRQTGAKVGLSLRPGTQLGRIERWLDRIDLAVVMSVEPGFGGQAFLHESLERIRMLRRKAGERLEIHVDGGIQKGNIREVAEAGANVAVAGSAIYGSADPEAAVRALIARGSVEQAG